MPNLKLTYFDIDGGRGEAARLAMKIGKVPFEDHRFPFTEFEEVRKGTPFSAVPVLSVDGEVIAQSLAINRYVGKLANLYPDDPLEALRCDEILGVVEDAVSRVVTTFAMEEEEKKAARGALADGPLTTYLKGLEKKLLAQGGEYFAGGCLTVADLSVFVWILGLRGGILDYVPTDLCDRVAPRLVEHFERIGAHPVVAAHYAA